MLFTYTANTAPNLAADFETASPIQTHLNPQPEANLYVKQVKVENLIFSSYIVTIDWLLAPTRCTDELLSLMP